MTVTITFLDFLIYCVGCCVLTAVACEFVDLIAKTIIIHIKHNMERDKENETEGSDQAREERC